MFQKIKKIGFISFAILLATFLFNRQPFAVVGDIIETLLELGPVQPISGGMSYFLFSEGGPFRGRVAYTDIVNDPSSNNSQCTFNATVTVLVNNFPDSGASSITVHNAHFLANSLAGHLAPLNPTSGCIPFTIYMNRHDPVNPSEASGKYVGATQVKYRGVMELNNCNFCDSRSSLIEMVE
jgi:hypothetical protein